MITIKVFTDSSPFAPVIFENVDFYHETRKTLEIIQEESYKTTITTFFKEHLINYSIIENRA